MREASVVASLQLQVVGDGVLVVEFHLPAAVVDVHWTILIAVLRFLRRLVVGGGVTIPVVVVRLPAVEADVEFQEVCRRELMTVVQFCVQHVHAVTAHAVTEHHVGILRCSHRTIMIRCGAGVVAATIHKHSAQRDVVFLGGMQGDSSTAEKVVALSFVLAVVVLVGISKGIELSALAAALVVAVTVAYIQVGIK